MDVSGIVIAASEVIRFEKGVGMILTVCNTCMNYYFCILVKDSLIKLWKKIYVNQYYSFSHLKIGAIELLSGVKFNTLIATLKSEFQEIVECNLEKMQVSSNLLKVISIPKITFNSEIRSLPMAKLISYKGVITKVKNSNLGLYEVDGKVHLYCIFNSFRSILPVLEEGLSVFISNAHFFIDFMNKKVLVCCGLSSVRLLDIEGCKCITHVKIIVNLREGETCSILEFLFNSLQINCEYLCDLYSSLERSVTKPTSLNLCHYSLSTFDVLWLEMLLSKLNRKFHPSVISNSYSFDWKNEVFINKILECFTISSKGLSSSSDRKSIGEEYCSNPHSCNVFCADILPTGCKILQISEILDKASSEISWTENSESWKTCFIKNESKYILIGMLYLSKDGSWYIMDESCDIPIMFTQNCSQCTFSKNTLCLFDDLNLGYLTVLQNFDIVHEKIKFTSSSSSCYRYLRTACCYPFYLGKYFKKTDNLFYHFPTEELFPLKEACCSVDEVTSLLENTHLVKKKLLTNVSQNNNSHFHDDLNNNVSCQYFLVLNKIWTIVAQVFVCYQILVLLLPQEDIFEEYFDKSRSLLQDTSNFYETDDDYDFAELVNQMDSLFLEDKPRLARLHFELPKQCAVLLPGHIYSVNLSDNLSQDAKFSAISNKNSLKPVLIKVKPSMKILHHLECFGNHSPDDYEKSGAPSLLYCGVKEIISERKVRENSLIKAILKDKCYEEYTNSCSSSSETDVKKTFCMVLKDSESEVTIKVYLPFCPKNLYGLVPGIQLQMYGFVCICSKRGYFYLTPSSSFGIQTINYETSHHRDTSIDSLIDDFYPEETFRISSLRDAHAGSFFKCLCFIVKIVSAKINLSCNSCGKDFEQKCLCFCSYNIKLSASFIIDDGTDQILVYSSDEAARKVLKLDVKELEKLSSFVTETRSCITFHYKMSEKETICSSAIEDVFYVYCSSKFLCRQACLKCKKKSNQQTIWCYDVLQITETDLIREFLIELGKN